MASLEISSVVITKKLKLSKIKLKKNEYINIKERKTRKYMKFLNTQIHAKE